MRVTLTASAVILFLMAGVDTMAATTTCSSVVACVLGNNASSAPGVAGISASGFGVSGSSQSNNGVNGRSASSFGVVGFTMQNATSVDTAKAGVLGRDASTNKKTYNSGVAGTSAYGVGVSGYGGTYGGSFTAGSGIGLYAVGARIFGSAIAIGDGDGLDALPSGGISPGNGDPKYSAIRAYANETFGFGDNLFVGVGCIADPDNPVPNCNDVASIDGSGNAIFSGTITQNGEPFIRTKSAAGPDVASFGARAAAPTIEDFGKASLRNGAAYVALERTFASTIDPRGDYMVFITPEGDSNGLYTSRLTAGGFTVRESKGGHSSLTFDYRIVARPIDAKAMHLPAMATFRQLQQHVRLPATMVGARRPALRR